MPSRAELGPARSSLGEMETGYDLTIAPQAPNIPRPQPRHFEHVVRRVAIEVALADSANGTINLSLGLPGDTYALL